MVTTAVPVTGVTPATDKVDRSLVGEVGFCVAVVTMAVPVLGVTPSIDKVGRSLVGEVGFCVAVVTKAVPVLGVTPAIDKVGRSLVGDVGFCVAVVTMAVPVLGVTPSIDKVGRSLVGDVGFCVAVETMAVPVIGVTPAIERVGPLLVWGSVTAVGLCDAVVTAAVPVNGVTPSTDIVSPVFAGETAPKTDKVGDGKGAASLGMDTPTTAKACNSSGPGCGSCRLATRWLDGPFWGKIFGKGSPPLSSFGCVWLAESRSFFSIFNFRAGGEKTLSLKCPVFCTLKSSSVGTALSWKC